MPNRRIVRLLVFFFKQKTAYEIMCDWSSDVCSSDLMWSCHGSEGTLPQKSKTPPASRRHEVGGVPNGSRFFTCRCFAFTVCSRLRLRLSCRPAYVALTNGQVVQSILESTQGKIVL